MASNSGLGDVDSIKPTRDDMGIGKPCFPYDTLIDVPGGRTKIGDLKKGQFVLSSDEVGGIVQCVITRKRVRGLARIMLVEFDTGKTLRATGHHSFFTKRGWNRLSHIRPGDEIVRADGEYSVVKNIILQGVEPVFNIYTAGEHNFFADGLLAHNFTEFRVIRTIWHQVFLDPIAKL